MKFKQIHLSSPSFDRVAFIARRHRITAAHARLVIELAGIGGKADRHVIPPSSPVQGGPAR